MGSHLRLFFRTINTSRCVPMRYVSVHAYHQSAYICSSARSSAVNHAHHAGQPRQTHLVIRNEDGLAREAERDHPAALVPFYERRDLLGREPTLALRLERDYKLRRGEPLAR